MLRAELGLLALERTSANVQDERIVAEHIAKPRLRRAHAKIVFFSVPGAKYGIEGTDRVDQPTSYVKAKSNTGRQVRIGRHGRGGERFAQRFAIVDVTQRVVLAKAGKRTDFGVVRKRRDRSDSGVRGGTTTQRPQPFPVTIVSELSSTTSAREFSMPRFAVPMKPRLRSLRNGEAPPDGSAPRAPQTTRQSRDQATHRRSA
jgi:hypothetical protein